MSIASALALCWVTSASAQVTAAGQQALAFGVLTPGVAAAVTTADVARRGEWLLTGRGTTTISLILPAALVSAAGRTIPLSFGATDGAWQRTSGGPVNVVDPRGPFSVTVPNRQTVRLFLGGTALPPAAAPAGTYTATITLIIAQP